MVSLRFEKDKSLDLHTTHLFEEKGKSNEAVIEKAESPYARCEQK